jgi:hypothetical protein
MKKQTTPFLALLILLLASAATHAAESKIYVDGQLVKDVDHLFVDQKVKVIVRSKKGELVSGKLGNSESPRKKMNEVTLEYKVTKSDLRVGYIVAQAFFIGAKGQIQDSFVKVLPILSQKEIERRAKETDEEKVKRVLKELGLDKEKCDSLFEN